MGKSEDVLKDSYHDDPVGLKSNHTRKKPSPIFAIIALVVGGGFFLQTTLASNISLSSDSSVEFGQGTLKTTACSGDTQLTLTPTSTFTNVAGAGSYEFSSVTVSGIPDSCWGKDFTINAYEESSNTPVALFNTTSTSVVVYNNAGAFEPGVGGYGFSVTSGSGTFTATFSAPVALSSSVFRITIQSGAHEPAYVIGSVGPGGGNVFYISATPFACGPTLAQTCTYLESAPFGWLSGSQDPDPAREWTVSAKHTTDVPSIPNEGTGTNNTSSAIGLGYKNSLAIIAPGNDSTSAAGIARAYTGGGLNDWYLPTSSELNQLCKWVNGEDWVSDATVCEGGTINTGLGAFGFSAGNYWASSEFNASFAHIHNFNNGVQNMESKSTSSQRRVRPIRAF